MGSSNSRLVWIICGLLISLVLLVWSHTFRSSSKLESEYLEAGTIYVSSAKRLADIEQIGKSSDKRATQFLVNLTLDGGVPFDSREAAARVLASKKDPSISADLASLLQPQTSESLRHAVAAAILPLPCSRECVKDVLHYLERMWWGESNSEDVVTDSPPTKQLLESDPELVKQQIADVQAQQKELVSQLENVLVRNRGETIAVLEQVYGLGSFHPAPFAVHMVVDLKLSEACASFAKPHLEDIAGEKLGQQIRDAREKVCD
ncbi:MAG TPA: hypothetical protein VJR23_19620 [Candidatus Acidoferrales bacterium]|nr:hypothetical protein [Candidatus Acidoferrales bacterium]